MAALTCTPGMDVYVNHCLPYTGGGVDPLVLLLVAIGVILAGAGLAVLTAPDRAREQAVIDRDHRPVI